MAEQLLAAGAAVDGRNEFGRGLRADFRFRAGQMGKGPTERDVGDEGLWKWIRFRQHLERSGVANPSNTSAVDVVQRDGIFISG